MLPIKFQIFRWKATSNKEIHATKLTFLEFSTLKDSNEFFDNNMLININDKLCQSKEDNTVDWEILTSATCILDTKYKQVSTNRVAANQKQLNPNQCLDLKNVLAKYHKLFDGSLGVHPHQKVYIDILPGSKEVHHQAYLVPCANEQTFKRNSKNGWYWNSQGKHHLMGFVLIHCCQKDGQVRQISDLCSLNKCIKCKKIVA